MKHVSKNKMREALTAAGFKEKEIDVYSSIANLGYGSVLDIAKHSGLPRPTVHNIIEDLLQKELLTEEKNGKKRVISLGNSLAREKELQKHRQRMLTTEESVYGFLPILENLKKSINIMPNVRSYEGIDGMRVMLEEVVKDGVDMFVLSDNKRFSDRVSPSTIRKSYSKRARNGIFTKMIFAEGFDDMWYGDKNDFKIEIKTIKKEYIMNGAINIWGNKVALHSYRNNAYSTVIIENQEITRLIKFMWSLIWNSAKSFK